MMKRFICLVLALMTLLTLVACGNVTGGEQGTTDSKEENTVFTGKLDAESYDGVFKAGYSRKDITPVVPINQNDGTVYSKVLDKLYATCVAVNDGETTALMFTIDTKGLGTGPYESIIRRVSMAVSIPEENIMITASHSHTAPMPGVPASDPKNIRWVAQMTTAMVDAAKEAIADLSDAEIHNGTTEVKGMAFVRRWIYEDGTPGGIWRQPNNGKITAYESEADNSVQIIRFVREDKKDILISNLQTHFTEAGNYVKNSISADLADILRSMVEILDEDALFAVYVGASGNIATGAHVDGTKKFGNYQKMGKAVAEAIIETPLTKVEAGKLQADVKIVTTNVRKDDAETVEKAKKAQAEISALNLYDGDAAVLAIAAKYGFEGAKEINSIISRNTNYKATREHRLGVISFGDIAFAAVPYEMFDTNGMELKNGSPYNMTFVLTNAGGAGAYVPSALAVPNGGYEVYTAVDEFGTGERIVGEFLTILREHKGIK
ncbi:MAG: hypothetical protein IKB02_03335 [Clostridia bacterium]|nr:hypothetical protein [Clostridia bacterium]